MEAKLEQFEWDNVWFQNANDFETGRIAYIGDSISCGMRDLCNREAAGKVYFDNFASSRAVDNPFFADALRLFLAQEKNLKAILFNNGLHGWQLSAEEYKEGCRALLTLLASLSDAPIVLVLSTHLPKNEKGDTMVRERNEALRALADAFSLRVIDLYAVSQPMPEKYGADGVHFLREGYEVLAKTVVSEALGAI